MINTHDVRKEKENLLSYRKVRKILKYDHKIKRLVWLVDRRTVKTGDIAGCIASDGYWHVKINGIVYKGHRLVWLLCHKRWPVNSLDHIDHDRSNLDIHNLVEVTHEENHRNRSVQKNNGSGVTGVCWDKARLKYRAYISVNKKQEILGFYDDFNEAIKVRKAAELEFGYVRK